MCTSCNCGTAATDTTDTAQPIAIGAAPASYTVTGMTCGHCVASVTEEVTAIEGVRDVMVDLSTGKLTFESDQPVPHDTVEAAVREAGYALA
ncbi:heavy-metal-associated domain-containing protein [Flexivirga alba]|uniref:Heavy-metal-associated domain-containing protein n=1 Tax=Flexivirga alba TaxID=702742 RepID=A0ABW2AIH1_9MICO